MGRQFICPRDEFFGPTADAISDVLAHRDRLFRALYEIAHCRNEFEGPSLDYMQGYRDGQQHLQETALRALNDSQGT